MLTYLIIVVRTMAMAVVLGGLILGRMNHGKSNIYKRILIVCLGVGIVLSMVDAYFHNATSMLDSAIVKGWIYGISIVAWLGFLVCILIQKVQKKEKNTILDGLEAGCAGITLGAATIYALSEVWPLPYHILQSEGTILSTDFLMGLIGVILGIIVTVVMGLAVLRSIEKCPTGIATVVLVLQMTINILVKSSGLISVFFQKRVLTASPFLFDYTIFVKNHEDVFIFLSLLLAVAVGVIQWGFSFKQKEPYRNPAEHRLIRAKWRRIRRWATTIGITGVMCVLTLTVLQKIDETEVTLSPIESATDVDDTNVYVSFDLVNDGRLHRFAYQTEDNVEIRFIVIKKPNSSSYGIGLDACDVCGQTGYYERDGQVVCNRCDVVMNVSTIGFKGGCNPIVIPYEIKDGQIIVPISGLLEYESEFK